MELKDTVKQISQVAFIRPQSQQARIASQTIDAVASKQERERIERIMKDGEQ